MMDEREIQELLGAFALDAVTDGERQEIELHLGECPRCRAEVAGFQEVAALMANNSEPLPEGLWNQIASTITPDPKDQSIGTARIFSPSSIVTRRRDRDRVLGIVGLHTATQRRSRSFSIGVIGAAAAIVLVVTLLSLQVANLSREITTSNRGASALGAAAASVLAHPHQLVSLRSNSGLLDATVAVDPTGAAYWITSNLHTLPSSQTYQLWTVVRGSTVVSLGVLGDNPSQVHTFHLDPTMRKVLVTIEPSGGTTLPTNSVLLKGSLA